MGSTVTGSGAAFYKELLRRRLLAPFLLRLSPIWHSRSHIWAQGSTPGTLVHDLQDLFRCLFYRGVCSRSHNPTCKFCGCQGIDSFASADGAFGKKQPPELAGGFLFLLQI